MLLREAFAMNENHERAFKEAGFQHVGSHKNQHSYEKSDSEKDSVESVKTLKTHFAKHGFSYKYKPNPDSGTGSHVWKHKSGETVHYSDADDQLTHVTKK